MKRWWSLLIVNCLVACASENMVNETPDLPTEPTRPAETVVLPNPLPATLADTELGKAVRGAALEGATLRAARANEASARTRIEGARSLRRPEISLSARAGITSNTDDNLFPSVTMSQLVYDSGSSKNQIDAALSRTRAAEASTLNRISERTLQALNAWEDLNLAYQLQDIATAAAKRFDLYEARVVRRIDAGAGRNSDALRVASRRYEAEAELARATGRVSAAEARARELFRVVPEVGAVPPAPGPNPGFGRNPIVAEINATILAARSELRAREAERFPSVFLDVFGDLDTDGDSEVGAGFRLDFTVGTSGRRKAAIEVARSEVLRLIAERDLLLETLERSAAEVASRRTALSQELASAKRSEASAREALENAEAGFSGGRFNIIDLTDLASDLDRAASRRAEVNAVFRLSGYERLAVSGDLLDVFGIVVTEKNQ